MKLLSVFGRAKSQQSPRASWLLRTGFAFSAMLTAFAMQAETTPAFAQEGASAQSLDAAYTPSQQVRRADSLAAECMTDFCENTNGRDRQTLSDGTRWNGVAVTANGRVACSRLASSYGVTLNDLDWDRPITECENRITGRAIIDYLNQTYGFSSTDDLVQAGWGSVHNGVFTFSLNKARVIEILQAFSADCQAEEVVPGTPNRIEAYVAPAIVAAPALAPLELSPFVNLGDAEGEVNEVLSPDVSVVPTPGPVNSTVTVEAPRGVDIIVDGANVGNTYSRDGLLTDDDFGFQSRHEGSGVATVTLRDCEQGNLDNCATASDNGTLTWNAAPREIEGGLYRVATPGTPFNTSVPFFTDDEGVNTGSFLNARPDGFEIDAELNVGEGGLQLGTAADVTWTNGRWEVNVGAMSRPQGPITMEGLLNGDMDSQLVPYGSVSFDVFNDSDAAFRARLYGSVEPSLVGLPPANVRGSLTGTNATAILADAAGTDPVALGGALLEYSPNDGDTVIALDVAGGITLDSLAGDDVTGDVAYLCNNCGNEADDAAPWRATLSATHNFNLLGSPDDSNVTAYVGRFGGAESRMIPDHLEMGPMEGDIAGVSGFVSTGRFELEGNYSTLNADCEVNCTAPAEIEAQSSGVAANVVFRDVDWAGGADLRFGPFAEQVSVTEGQYGAPGRFVSYDAQSYGLRVEGRWQLENDWNVSAGLQVSQDNVEQEYGRTNRAGFSGSTTNQDDDLNVSAALRVGRRF
ncbi:MAG: hypothetical protein GC136_07510 [Alphaproteobacteria bacterium]|nr:hypothetical protein [Alphaproteobacteria bacterium]